MQNRSIYKFILLLLTVALVEISSSCKKSFLEKKSYGIQGLDNYFRNETECLTFLNTCYLMYETSEWFATRFPRLLMSSSTDDGWAGNDYQDRPAEVGTAAFTTVDPNNGYIDSYYGAMYQGVRNCNYAVIKFAEAPVSHALKKRIIGEAKFMRALYYFDLVKTFGDCVLYTDLPDASQLIPRSPASDVYKQIVQDLQDAATDLPEKDQYDAKDKGRATKGAALGMLAKVYLFIEDYQKAEATAAQVIQSGKYSLEPNFGDNWKTTNPYGRESLFEFGYAPNSNFAFGTREPTMTWSTDDGGWGWFGLTSNLENAYKAEGDSIRLRFTINRGGLPIAGDASRPFYPSNPNNHTSMRHYRKLYVPLAERGGQYGNPPLNSIVLRYADLLLVYAEACAFNNKPAEALTALNQVRTRVSLTPKVALTGDALKQAIWDERRLELAGEQTHRWDDIRRIKINGKKLIAILMGPNGTFVKYNTTQNTDPQETKPHRERLDKGIAFVEGKHELWPIPRNVINYTNKTVTQNSGY